MNNYSAIGHIAMDPKKGNGVANSLLAIKRIYKSNDGVEADFIPITLFGHQAENFDRLTKKGDKIGIDGSVRTNKYVDENGEIHYGWSVVVNHFYLLSTKPHNDSDGTLSDATVNSLSSKLDGLVKDSDLPF
ncbi:single-stranded DNA-binding protein [Lacticaseibacillus paracasei]|uniref:single-stranded DNA-binding protein n=1 Tax=Lacticaseibacillus paracasei TaxID=1597 RepID=UPI00237F2575|nr:single-stranded DNA-binding protein [Lacticaseibacillus paracasei]MDE3285512.1 single-stranded DNA-binding protein [Lacticaseibacillus paracasei]